MKEIGCKSAWPVHISPIFWAIERLLPCKIVKTCPRPAEFSLRFFKSDRLLAPLTREERAAQAHAIFSTQFNSKQQIFLDFVLSHYVSAGVEELDQAKLTPLLRLKYHDSIADAVADLGRPDEIGKVFSGFQKYLYQPAA